MRTGCVLLLSGLLLGLPGAVAAQGRLGDDEAIRALTDGFFEAFRQAGAQGAAAYLRQSGSMEEEVMKELERRARAAERNPFLGRPDSHVLVNENQIPRVERFRTFTFLTYHDSRSVAWRLRFYKKVTGVWVFIDVQWEQEFVEDFLRLSELEFAAYRNLLELRTISGEE